MQEGFPQIVNIADDLIHLHSMGVLELLLADHTTGGNILWATDAYVERGPQYEPVAEITASLITGPDNAGIIQTRARKAFEKQTARTKQRAEVYTPLWVVKMMCDHIDTVWFRRKDGFFKTIPGTDKIYFNKTRTWTAYVKNRRMELTCGEGPFLTSRYDAPTGESIKDVRERVGLLDRKLRVVSDNTATEAEWMKWARRAFQSVYGYEIQGDSLLIARVNAMMTFSEYYYARWGHLPKEDDYKEVAQIISWNIWQMDGLTGTISHQTIELNPQMMIDGFQVSAVSLSDEPKKCRIQDWKKKARRDGREYPSLKKEGVDSMKFDFIIGNPPYQDDVENQGDRPNPLYDKYMDAAYGIANRVELIHPARFLFDAGQTSKAWNKKMLSDEHIKVLYYKSDASEVFNRSSIVGGIAITYRDASAVFGEIGFFTPFAELNRIKNKVTGVTKDYLESIVSARGNYRLTPQFFSDFKDVSSRLGAGTGNMLVSNIIEKIPEAFSDEPQSGLQSIRVLGRLGNTRIYRYIDKRYIISNEFLTTYNVLLSEADGAAGRIGVPIPARIIGRPEYAMPNECGTDTFISIGKFQSRIESENLGKYLQTRFLRAMLGIKKATQHNPRSVWKYVPLQDFSSESDIDWAKTIPEIDQQLYAKYGLSEEEITFIESHVKEMT